ncbi:MAG: hypothetical protein GY794_18495, partial [bacterium]|nr:hypothetical protein [bacterium]
MPEDIQNESTCYELPLSPVIGKSAPQTSGIRRTAASEHTLATNARWFCWLRWCTVVILSLFGVFLLNKDQAANFGLGGDAAWAFVCAGILAVFNIAFIIHLGHNTNSPMPRSIYTNLWMQIVVDLLVLTGVVHFLGSL